MICPKAYKLSPDILQYWWCLLKIMKFDLDLQGQTSLRVTDLGAILYKGSFMLFGFAQICVPS